MDTDRVEEEPTEEVAFWRGFIEWWAREERAPVPSQAWAALAQAERKRPKTSTDQVAELTPSKAH